VARGWSFREPTMTLSRVAGRAAGVLAPSATFYSGFRVPTVRYLGSFEAGTVTAPGVGG